MKKILFSVFLFFAFFMVTYSVFAGEISGGGISVYQSLNHASFAMQGNWWNLDSAILPIGGEFMEDELEPYFFQEFDYVPDTVVDILKVDHPKDTYSVPVTGDELAVFRVQYADAYNQNDTNPPSAGYPMFILTYPNGSTQTFTANELEKGDNNYYKISLKLERGEYKYKYICTNDNYLYNDGFYMLEGNWYVTSKPYDFDVVRPKDEETTLPDSTNFAWTVLSDEGPLQYEIYLGTRPSKDGLTKIHSGGDPKEHSVSGLEHTRQYYWYMVITNGHGASIETKLYTFNTGGNVKKFFNAPNPFNPTRKTTSFVFNMPESGTAKIVIYSEYGDKVWESETYNFTGDIMSSKEIVYNGRDNSGKMLYNGTYIAVLTKKYGGQTKAEKCRILVIK